MFDPKHPRYKIAAPGHKLDPATLPTGLPEIPDPQKRGLRALLAAGLIFTADQLPPRKPPTIPATFLLYPFLFSAFPSWTYGLQAIGDCMSWSAAHNIDTLTGAQIFHLDRSERPEALACKELLYGLMRVEALGLNQNTGGDGAYPDAAAYAVSRFGTLHYKTYLQGKYSFLEYDSSGQRARRFGRYGCPDDLEPIAFEHRARQVVEVSDFDHACELLAAGYPISTAHSRNPIYRDRDSQGFGTNPWHASHAMNWIGYRRDDRPGLLQINSGHGYHVDGPRWPGDMPDQIAHCSAWMPAQTVDAICQARWCYAYADYEGFPKTFLFQRRLPAELVSPAAA